MNIEFTFSIQRDNVAAMMHRFGVEFVSTIGSTILVDSVHEFFESKSLDWIVQHRLGPSIMDMSQRYDSVGVMNDAGN